MNIYWLLAFQERLDEFATVLKRLDIPYGVHVVDPKLLTVSPEPKGSLVLPWGSAWLRPISAKYGWTPGCYHNDSFDFDLQRNRWVDAMLNYDAVTCRFEDIDPKKLPSFIRPQHDTKSLRGEVYDADTYLKMLDLVRSGGWPTDLRPDTMVVVGSVKRIRREWRLWIVSNRIVTHSLYEWTARKWIRYTNELLDEVRTFAEGVVSRWSPDKAFVLDVAETDDGCRVLEVNSINHSSLYDAQIEPLVVAMRDLVEDRAVPTL